MKVYEPYSLHYSVQTDDVYEEYEPPVDTSISEYI